MTKVVLIALCLAAATAAAQEAKVTPLMTQELAVVGEVGCPSPREPRT